MNKNIINYNNFGESQSLHMHTFQQLTAQSALKMQSCAITINATEVLGRS